MKKILSFLFIGLIGISALFTGSCDNPTTNKNAVNAANTANAANKPKTPVASSLLSAPPGASPAWSKGSPNAPVTLEEFSDFECPACAGMFPILRDMKIAYGEQVRLIFRQYPLTQIHQKALEASRATEAAGNQGKFWEMHDMIYANQKTWKDSKDVRETFAEYAKNLGLNVDKFKAETLSSMIDSRINLDMKRGDAIPVRSTPTIFLNGRMLTTEELSADGLRKAIDAAIQEKGATAPPAITSTAKENASSTATNTSNTSKAEKSGNANK